MKMARHLLAPRRLATLIASVLLAAPSPALAAPADRACAAPALQKASSLKVGSEPVSVVAGDFNKDSFADVAVANSGSDDVSVALGDGRGGFAPPVSYGVGRGPRALAVADLDGDRALDLVVAHHVSKTVMVLKGDGGGKI